MRVVPTIAAFAAAVVFAMSMVGCSSPSGSSSESSLQNSTSEAAASSNSGAVEGLGSESGDAASKASESGDAASASPESGNVAIGKSEDAQKTKDVKVGKTIKGDTFEFELTDTYWLEADDRGMITFYDSDGMQYNTTIGTDQWAFALQGNFYNDGNKAFSPLMGFYGEATVNDEYSLSADYMICSMANSFEVQPLDTSQIVIFAAMPSKMRERFESGELLFAFDSVRESKVLGGGFEGMGTIYRLKF